MKRIINTVDEKPDRENIVKVQKYCTIEDVILVIEKPVGAIKPETRNSCWRKLYPEVVHDFTVSTKEPIKEIMKDIVDMAKKVGLKCFKILIMEKFKS